MPNIVELPSFYLKKGVSKSDFLLAHEKLNSEFISKQKGYISHMLLVNGDTWSDLVIWETTEDIQNAFKAVYENATAVEYVTLIEQIGTDAEIPIFSVVKNY